MVKRNKKNNSDLKEELRKEEVKERFTNIAFGLFGKGASDEAVMREISVFLPNIDVGLVRRLRDQWQVKQDVNKEIVAIDSDEKPEKIDEVGPTSEVKPDKPESKSEGESIVEPVVKPELKLEGKSIVESELEGKRELEPEEDELLDAVEKDALQQEDEIVEKPVTSTSKEDLETIETLGVEGKVIDKTPTPSLHDEVEGERSRAEIIRATEELRRAITSEIRAQESYERARLELDNAKGELNVVRLELDEFKRDVDMLKLKERVVERESMEESELLSDTERGKQLEQRVGMQPLDRVVGDIVEKKFKELEEKDEGVAVPLVPVEKKEEVVGRPVVGKEQDELDEKIQEGLGKVEKVQQELDAEAMDGMVVAKGFYDKLLGHLSSYKYLVVRMGKDEPEVFKQNLVMKGMGLGVSVGVPVGVLVCFVILALAGML